MGVGSQRNKKCSCGSGKKFKNCCGNQSHEMKEGKIITIDDNTILKVLNVSNHTVLEKFGEDGVPGQHKFPKLAINDFTNLNYGITGCLLMIIP